MQVQINKLDFIGKNIYFGIEVHKIIGKERYCQNCC